MVYLEGYAGEARYENGKPASAEIALRVASHFRARHGLTLECSLTESQPKSFERSHEVVARYRAGGVLAHAHRGEVDGMLSSAIQRAAREPAVPVPGPVWAGPLWGSSWTGWLGSGRRRSC